MVYIYILIKIRLTRINCFDQVEYSWEKVRLQKMDDGLNPDWATRVEKLSLADGFPGAYRHACEQLVQNLKTKLY